jgi:hypothetical protein
VDVIATAKCEGEEPADTAVPRAVAYLRRVLAG